MHQQEGTEFNSVYYILQQGRQLTVSRGEKRAKVDVPRPHPYKIIPKS
jgi:hypothetical protein